MEINTIAKNKLLKLKKIKSKCPTCKKKSTNIHNPFCSNKCADIDLMKWLSDENFLDLNPNL